MDIPLGAIGSILKSGVSWFNRPKVSFLFEQKLSKDNENEYCHYRINTSERNVPGWFFRLGVVNTGKTGVLRSDVRVERIIRQDDGKVIVGTPFFLHWANEKSDDSRNLYKELPVFVDLVYTVTGADRLFIYPKSKHAGAGIRSSLEKGSYIFELKLVGEAVSPVPQKVSVSFNGEVDGVEIKLVS